METINLDSTTLPTKSVIVYSDRAEVKRTVAVELKKGTTEIVVENVSAVIERQSVRVDGPGVIIQEVHYQELPTDENLEADKLHFLEVQKDELENERFGIEDEMASIRKRIEVLDGVAAQIAVGGSFASRSPSLSNIDDRKLISRRHTITGDSDEDVPSKFFFDESSLTNLAKFLTYYGETVRDMKKELRHRQRDCQLIAEKVDIFERQIDQLRCGAEYDKHRRNISIVVEAEAEGAVELFVSYQVYCVSWRPTYDIRASTAEDAEQHNLVQLCYYGLVEQNTGDDWKNAEMILSTSEPSIGGSPPQLGVLWTALRRPSRRSGSSRPRQASSAQQKWMSSVSDEDKGFVGSFDYDDTSDGAAYRRMLCDIHNRSSEENSVSAKGVDHNISTCFSIPRPVTIISNGADHKLLIAKIDLPCQYFHETVPSMSASAYLSAMVTNDSTMTLLPGRGSVFVNNCFITKTHLPLVTPNEEFCCHLGVDPSIKVEYRAPKVAHEQVGFMSKSTLVTHEQVVLVRSAKLFQKVRLTLKEQVPKSRDEKIKIAVVSPDLRTKTARLNLDHNLEWTVQLAPGEQKELPIRYTIEHPASEHVTFKVGV